MSKPRFRWWGYIKAVVRAYPLHHEKLYNSKLQHTTAPVSVIPCGSGINRTTEALALRQLPADAQREYDAVYQASRQTMREHRWNGAERLQLIDMVYWRQSHKLEGAAMVLNISYGTAKNWHNDFIVCVAVCMGLYHPEE